jgi:thymidylate kinase
MEKESLEFFERVRRAYGEMSDREPQRIRIIDASQAIGSIQETMRRIFHERFAL